MSTLSPRESPASPTHADRVPFSWSHFSPSAGLAAVLALLVGYSGPFLIIVHAAQSAGLSAAQLVPGYGRCPLPPAWPVSG
jgi:benzoate membrane transport protein